MVTFEKNRDLERWLRNRPSEIANIEAARIATRAALRVIPVIGIDIDSVKTLEKLWRLKLALPTFRACLISHSAARYPDVRHIDEAVFAVQDVYVSFPLNAVSAHLTQSVYNSIKATRSISEEIDPEDDGIEFAYNAAVEAYDADIFVALELSVDATGLERNQDICSFPLWSSIPTVADLSWKKLRSELLRSTLHWKVWIDWYEDRLHGDAWAAARGRPTIREHQIELALIPEEDWNKGAKHVNAIIKKLERKYWGDWENKGTLEPTLTTPLKPARSEEAQQAPAPYIFRVAEKIEAVPQSTQATSSDLAASLAKALLNKADKARTQLTENHADADILDAIGDLCLTLHASPLAEGAILMVYRDLQAAVDTYVDPGNERHRTIISLLTSLVRSTEDLLNCFPGYQQIEAHRVAMQFVSADLDSYRRHVDDLISAIQLSALVAESSVKALNVGLGTIDGLSKRIDSLAAGSLELAGILEKRAIVASTHSLDVRNFAAAVIEKAEKDPPKNPRPQKSKSPSPAPMPEASPKGFLSKAKARIEKGVLSGLEKGAEKVIVGAMVGGAAGLVHLAAGPIAGIAAGVAGLQPASRKINQLRSEYDSEDGVDPPETA